MKVVIASDHAGLELKREILEAAKARSNLEIEDLGAHASESVDYPDFATQVAKSVSGGVAHLGVLICGTGIGMSIVANKHRGIRAALCHTEFEARMSRQHNDANVLCLGQRVTGAGLGRSIFEAFLDARFEGGRHQRRVDKISDAERNG